MVGETYLPINAYYPRTPDYTCYSGIHACWSEQLDSTFVSGFMSLDYDLGTMTTSTFKLSIKVVSLKFDTFIVDQIHCCYAPIRILCLFCRSLNNQEKWLCSACDNKVNILWCVLEYSISV